MGVTDWNRRRERAAGRERISARRSFFAVILLGVQASVKRLDLFRLAENADEDGRCLASKNAVDLHFRIAMVNGGDQLLKRQGANPGR